MVGMISWDATEELDYRSVAGGGRTVQTAIRFRLHGPMKCEYCDINPTYIITPIPGSDVRNLKETLILCDDHYKSHIFKVFGGTE